jgi:hypothetical protein
VRDKLSGPDKQTAIEQAFGMARAKIDGWGKT